MHAKRRRLGRLGIGLMTQLMTRTFENPYKSRGLGLMSRGSSPVSRTKQKGLRNSEDLFAMKRSFPSCWAQLSASSAAKQRLHVPLRGTLHCELICRRRLWKTAPVFCLLRYQLFAHSQQSVARALLHVQGWSGVLGVQHFRFCHGLGRDTHSNGLESGVERT